MSFIMTKYSVYRPIKIKKGNMKDYLDIVGYIKTENGKNYGNYLCKLKMEKKT